MKRNALVHCRTYTKSNGTVAIVVTCLYNGEDRLMRSIRDGGEASQLV